MRSVNKTKYRKYRQGAHLATAKSDAIVQDVTEKARTAKKSTTKAAQSVANIVAPLLTKAQIYTNTAGRIKAGLT